MEGAAEALVAVTPEVGFAWLADPAHASEWFASVEVVSPLKRPLQPDAIWRFRMTRQGGREIPMRLTEYRPVSRFAWETNYPSWRDNLRWDLTVTPASPETDSGAASAGPATRLRLVIVQRPGPLGIPLVALAALLGRLGMTRAASMDARAERAVERARAALESLNHPGDRSRRPRRPDRPGRRR